MNRAARRREQRIKKAENKNVITLTQEQLMDFMAQERNLVTVRAIDMITSVACIVLKDKHGFGKKRMTDFIKDMMIHCDLINKHEESVGDLITELWDMVPDGTFSKEWIPDGESNELDK